MLHDKHAHYNVVPVVKRSPTTHIENPHCHCNNHYIHVYMTTCLKTKQHPFAYMKYWMNFTTQENLKDLLTIAIFFLETTGE